MPGDQPPIELFRKVFEAGVECADEIELLFSTPPLELLLPRDGCSDVFVLLVVEEACAAVLFREAFECAFFVLLDADVELAGHANVECASVTSHDVGETGWHRENANSLLTTCCHPERAKRVEGSRGSWRLYVAQGFQPQSSLAQTAG